LNRYDEEVLALDSDLEQLFLELQRRGLLENSWIVITSDHGEAFGEHGVVKHLSSVYNEEVRIPLIVRWPQGEAVPSTSDAVSLIDVATTLAAVAGETSFGIGNDLRTMQTEPAPVQIEFFGTDDKKAAKLGFLAAVPARAVVMGNAKLIEYPESRELFKLDDDPNERRNFEQTAPAQVAKLTGLLPPLTREQPIEVENKDLLSPEQIERLRALGYIE
jgi:arylsulfatase A-like enzyme